MKKEFDWIILGAGIYGMYAAKLLLARGYKVAVLEFDPGPFRRASYINQARVHNGYHYPRSYATAIKSAHYFDRFNREFSFAVSDQFRQLYAISSVYSMVSGDQFAKFCRNVNIPAKEVDPAEFFNEGTVEKVFETNEFSFDAGKIRESLLSQIKDNKNLSLYFTARVKEIAASADRYSVRLDDGSIFAAAMILNATYASVNQIIDKLGFNKFKVKYEICEVITCSAGDRLKSTGITVMDGPFFSLMPFGLPEDGVHSLTSVCFTPHKTSYNDLPVFDCQQRSKVCTPGSLDNCNSCDCRPASAWPFMMQMAKKYLLNSDMLAYRGSLFAIKPILTAAEIDDSRPTVIKVFSKEPGFISVLSGKINAIYDLEGVL